MGRCFRDAERGAPTRSTYNARHHETRVRRHGRQLRAIELPELRGLRTPRAASKAGGRKTIAVNRIATFLANLESVVRSMTTEQKMSLISAVVAVGGLAVAILAHLQAAKAYKLAKAAEERATYRSVIDRLARQIYIKARRDLEWNQTLHKLHPNEKEYEDPGNRASVKIDEDLDADFDEVIALVYERYPDIDKVERCGGECTTDDGKAVTLYLEVIFKKIGIQEK